MAPTVLYLADIINKYPTRFSTDKTIWGNSVSGVELLPMHIAVAVCSYNNH